MIQGKNRRLVSILRRFFLMPFSCKWNAWIRDTTAILG